MGVDVVTLQQTNKERPSRGPTTRRGIIMAKDKLTRPASISHGQQGDDDDDNTRASPVNADLVDKIQVSRAKGIHQRTHEHNSPEAQHRLPLIGHKILIKDGDGAKDELRSREVDGQGDGPVADKSEPTIDEADQGRITFRTEHSTPIIHASGCGEDGADLGE